jgi:predicted MFS family arabinose efflux permease
MFALGALALVPDVPLPLVLILAFAAGITQTLGGPAYIAVVNDLVPPGVVPSGVSLTFLGFNIGRIVGGFLGGLLIAVWPTGWALIAAAALQALPALAIWRIRTPPPPERAPGRTSLVRPLLEAARYAGTSPWLRVLLPLAIAPGALGLSYTYLLPVAAVELGIGAEGLGVLLAVTGAGGLVMGLASGALMRAFGHGAMVFAGIASAGIGMVVFGLAPATTVAVAAMSLVGGGLLAFGASSMSLVQALAPSRLRGRLTSLFTLLYWGLMPVGGLLGGAVSELSSARTTMAVFGSLVLVAGGIAMVIRRSVATLRIDEDAGEIVGLVPVEVLA